MQSLIDLFGVKNLIPHGYCLSWSPVLLWLNVISDLLITLFYYSIPLMLVYFIRRRKDLPYPGLVAMFAVFIMACGTTHLLSAITLWIPLYWLDALFKGLTAIISAATAALMLRVIPRALSVPSAAQLQAEMQQRKTAEEALHIANVELQENIARTQLLLDSALDGIVSIDHNGNVVGWNNQAEHIFGYSAEQALGRQIAELIVPLDYREKHRQGLLRFMSTGVSHIIGTRVETTGVRKDGSEFPIELTVSALEQNDRYLFNAYVRDISERKQAEAAQRDALDKLQKIAAQLPGVVFQFRLRADGSCCLPYASDVLHDIYRFDPEEVRDDAAKVFADVHPDDLEQHLASIQTSAHDLTPWRNEYRLRFADGTERWLFGNALPQREQDGSVLWHGFVSDISERKQMEEKLRDSDAFNLSILNSLTSNIAVLDAQGIIVAVNNAWRRFAAENGLLESGQDMLGINYLDTCKNAVNRPYGDEANAARAGIAAVLAGEQESFHLEYPCHSPAQQRWFYMNVSPLRGSRSGVVVSHENITERKKAQELTQAAYQYSRSLIEASLDPLVTISATGKITDVNSATEQVTGVNRNNLIGSDFADYFTNPDKARDGYLQVFSQGFVNDYPLAIRHTSGNVTEVLYNASVYRDENGDVLGVFAAARDITERKLMEDELKASEAKFRSIIEVSPVPMALNDEQLNITFLNQAFVQTFGYTVDDIPTLADWWPKAYPDPDYRHWVAETWQAALENAEREHQPFRPMELNIRSKDGVVKTVLASAAIIADSFKDEHLVVLYDITERKQAELAKRHSEEQLQAFYELDLVGLTITSPEKGWIRINDCLCRMLEYSEQSLRQMTWAELTHPDDLAADIEQFNKLLANEINGYALEKRFVSRTGKIIPTKLVVRSIRKTNGELDYVVAMVEDITEYKQAEAELKRSNAELEQFAYAVSHDMRQPLRMVSSYLSLIENALTGSLDEEKQQFLDFAIDGAKRMDTMILSLLDYSRVGRKTETKTRISSKASLDEALAFLSPELSVCGGEIKVTGAWPELIASRDELTRLLQNLIGNALKYHEENQAPQVHVHGIASASLLRVEVRDQGIGIEPSQMDRLFKVFSRLQARSRFGGTGVGLALCRKIVEHHGGAIGVESAGEGQGCVFWFELPMASIVNAE
ncbi:PAS domain S-box protein [Methylobacter sp.]|uniref:PAS domain S-box protein n=1 Tax=Methylobacter sp. TaxID=2051955 RepID=UPI0012037528|nr:PAS domain S-box protein [Methylobacter sp.]TAK64885.1 MAG: PAS domain S-box protein [Methylobacter sp.]